MKNVTITDLTQDGDGSAIVDGRKITVPGTAPGDQVTVSENAPPIIATSGPNRQDPPCPHFPACGGCSAQQLAADRYTEWKRSKITDALVRRTGMTATKAGSLVANLMTTKGGERRRADFAAEKTKQGLTLGFHQRGSSKIENIGACLVLRPALNDVLANLAPLLNKIMTGGQRLDIHLTECSNGIDATLRAVSGFITRQPDATTTKQLAEFAAANNIARISWRADNNHATSAVPVILRETPTVRLSGVDVAFPPSSFLQASATGEAAITGAVMACLKHVAKRKKGSRIKAGQLAVQLDGLAVADLYSGLGTLSLPIARAGAKVTAYDIDGPASEALAAAAKQSGAAIKVTPRNLGSQPLSAREMSNYDVLVADPPFHHEWVGPMKLGAVDTARRPGAIVYVSCDPETFAVGAKELADAGYILRRVIPIDQFIYTRHLELVALFEALPKK